MKGKQVQELSKQPKQLD